MTGHLGTASGAVEAVYCILALDRGVLPPTINYRDEDPECRLDLVQNTAKEQKINTALTINQGIGGQSTALILKTL
jgi:3-oxoacyl-[acyl-carrier-protein] synthase II